MPIYEEKLISPFAVRFTQEHIKTCFRDGRSVEATVAEIQEEPGTDGYDVILRFPFPAIEIVRYRGSSRRDTTVVKNGLGEELSGEHWFTLDNRRLYCLQRAAVACWPRRAAVAVDILYASPGSVRRKCDTTTYGSSVTIAASCHDSPLRSWDWRQEVFRGQQNYVNAINTVACKALDAIFCDDARTGVDQLLNKPDETCSAAERALKFFETGSVIDGICSAQGLERSGTPSTAEPFDGSDLGSGENSPRLWQASLETCERQSSPLKAAKEGARPLNRDVDWGADWNDDWLGYEDHAKWAEEEVSRQLGEPGNIGYVWIQSWSQIYAPYLGSLRDFVASRPDKFTLVPGGKGRGFRVVLAHPQSNQGPAWRHKGKQQRSKKPIQH